MGLFEHFPYTNFHELNLGWILEKLRDKTEALTKYGGGRSLGWTGFSHYKNEEPAQIPVPDDSDPITVNTLRIPPKTIGIVTWGMSFDDSNSGSGHRSAFISDTAAGSWSYLLGYPDTRNAVSGTQTCLSGAVVMSSGDSGKTVYLKANQKSGSAKNITNYFLKFTVLSGEIPDRWEW